MKFIKELTAPQPIAKPEQPGMTPAAAGGVPNAQAVSTSGDARAAVNATAKPSTSTAKPAPTAPATAAPATQPQTTTSAQATNKPIVPGQPATVVPANTSQVANNPQAQALMGRLQELAGIIQNRRA
jgi:hypothetical protein